MSDAKSWSGWLKDHHGPCWGEHTECDDRTCDVCGNPAHDTATVYRWGSWYQEDVGLCDFCGADDTPIACYYDAGSLDDSGYRCLPCVVRDHAQACGCELWRETENELRAARRDGGA